MNTNQGGGVLIDIPVAAQAALELQINEALRDRLVNLGLTLDEIEKLGSEDLLREIGTNFEVYSFKGEPLLTITRSEDESTEGWDYDFTMEGADKKD